MLRKPGFLEKYVNVIDKSAHGTFLITRHSVQVNPRYNVHPKNAIACYKGAMKSEWYERLKQALDEDSRSMRKVSQDAGLGPNFLQQLLKYQKDPGLSQLERIFDTLGPGTDIFVVTGLRISQQDAEFLKLLSLLDDEARADAISRPYVSNAPSFANARCEMTPQTHLMRANVLQNGGEHGAEGIEIKTTNRRVRVCRRSV